MKFRLWHRRNDRVRDAQDAVTESEKVHARIEAQWPEVLRHAAFAREQRQRNHLTDMFLNLRGGRS